MMEWVSLLNQERPRQSTSSEDHRSQFERDHDRCIFSTPVKRLQDKAQVFPLERNDSVRTRLTHSLEVSSVARGLAIGASKDMLEDGRLCDPADAKHIEVIAATCGLLHDIGNPPFGHAGEEAIQSWFLDRFPNGSLSSEFDTGTRLGSGFAISHLASDFYRFEGNAQTMRLVTKLQILADFSGLNLTYGTLSALLKYTASSSHVSSSDDHANSKPGYFHSETEIVQQIRERTGTGCSRNPITYLVEAADDITYSVADIEDAVKKGVLRWDQVKEAVVKCDLGQDVMEHVKRILRTGDRQNHAEHDDDTYASAFRTAAIGVMVKGARKVFTDKYNEIMQGTYTGELVKEGDSGNLVTILKKELGVKRVYATDSTLKLELMGRTVIWDLLGLFWSGAKQLQSDGTFERSFDGKAGRLLSSNYRRVFSHYAQHGDLPVNYYRVQLVTDYICGMTDTFATSLHKELFNG